MCSCMKRIAMKLHNLACNMWIMKDWALKHTCKHGFVEFHDYKHHWCHLKWNWSQKLTCMLDWWRYGPCMKFECMGFDHTREMLVNLRIRSWFWTIGPILVMLSYYVMCFYVFVSKTWVLNPWTLSLNFRNNSGNSTIWHIRSSGKNAARAWNVSSQNFCRH